jgi:hypothetical protein
MDLINGVPAHVLSVHIVVVLIPLTALALVLCAIWPSVMRRFGVVLPALALVALGSVPVTTQAGEWLEEHVRRTALVNKHTELGDGLLPWALGLFVMAVAVWWAYRRTTGTGTVSLPLRAGAVVLSLAVAVGASVQVYRIGDSGAKAAWENAYTTTENPGGG